MQVTARDVGLPKTIKVWHDNTGRHPDWFLEFIRIRKRVGRAPAGPAPLTAASPRSPAAASGGFFATQSYAGTPTKSGAAGQGPRGTMHTSMTLSAAGACPLRVLIACVCVFGVLVFCLAVMRCLLCAGTWVLHQCLSRT